MDNSEFLLRFSDAFTRNWNIPYPSEGVQQEYFCPNSYYSEFNFTQQPLITIQKVILLRTCNQKITSNWILFVKNSTSFRATPLPYPKFNSTVKMYPSWVTHQTRPAALRCLRDPAISWHQPSVKLKILGISTKICVLRRPVSPQKLKLRLDQLLSMLRQRPWYPPVFKLIKKCSAFRFILNGEGTSDLLHSV